RDPDGRNAVVVERSAEFVEAGDGFSANGNDRVDGDQQDGLGLPQEVTSGGQRIILAGVGRSAKFGRSKWKGYTPYVFVKSVQGSCYVQVTDASILRVNKMICFSRLRRGKECPEMKKAPLVGAVKA